MLDVGGGEYRGVVTLHEGWCTVWWWWLRSDLFVHYLDKSWGFVLLAGGVVLNLG